MLRWLLPVIAAIALVGSSITAWAAAGMIGDPTCCCPVKAKCKCHDHDGKPAPPTLKRCGGEAKLVAPAVTIAIAAAEVALAIEPRESIVPTIAAPPLPPSPSYAPEKPPF